MNKSLKALRSEQKKALSSADLPEDEFLQASAEGWEQVGIEKMDGIMSRLDQRVDEKTGLGSNPGSGTTVKKLWGIWSLGLAASVLLFVLGVWYFFRSQDPAPILADSTIQTEPVTLGPELFAKYFKPLEGPEPVFRGERDLKKTKQQVASTAYDARDFDLAIGHYQELLKEQPLDPKYTLFLGLAYMSVEEYDAAITLYNSYTPVGVTYDEDIEWYLALAHLKKGQLNSARAILEKLAAKEGSYYKISAIEIVAKLPGAR
jgi:hypothetical protein